LEHEVKEAKADVLRSSTECAEMKITLAKFQMKTNEALVTMVANHRELIASLSVRDDNMKKALDRRDDRLDRHSKKIGEDGNRVTLPSSFNFKRRLLTLSRLMNLRTRWRC
jgi:hypothetical protein